MLIEIHCIQNHSVANLNRDDLGAPKTCFFGGVIRSRISSQCIKRSIRMSDVFAPLCGGIRTRQLAKLIADSVTGKAEVKKKAAKVLEKCGIAANEDGRSDMLVYTTKEAIAEMGKLLSKSDDVEKLAAAFGQLITQHVAVPDMALSGRMLETGVLNDTTVEASLQVAHAFSTHEARPEVDYYVAADDIRGQDAGAGFVDEALFASACFYKYFSINWESLVGNLRGNQELAAHTVGAFIRAAATVSPSGKQNSFAAHNPPDGMIIEFKASPISYANAFANPVAKAERDVISQSIAQLGQYVHDLEVGYGEPEKRFWFSPNLRYKLSYRKGKEETEVKATCIPSLEKLVADSVKQLGHDWAKVQQVVTA